MLVFFFVLPLFLTYVDGATPFFRGRDVCRRAFKRPTDKGFTKMQATNFITVAAIVGLYVEDKKRWQSMGAFMAMSVFD